MFVGVGVIELVGVGVILLDGVIVGVFDTVGVLVGVFDTVGVGVFELPGVFDIVGVGVEVFDTVGVGVGVEPSESQIKVNSTLASKLNLAPLNKSWSPSQSDIIFNSFEFTSKIKLPISPIVKSISLIAFIQSSSVG